MASSSRPNDPGNLGNNEQSAVADALATMHRRMAEQDAKIQEQMDEIQNLRRQLLLQGGEGIGGNGGNPTDTETYDSHTRSGSVRVERHDRNENRPPFRHGFEMEPLYARFGKMKPTEFAGSTNPLEAEEWLSSIETILEFMRLTDQERVSCASFMLKKDARHWWATVKVTRDVTEMTWADFVSEFNQKYYKSAILRAQQDEFMNLKQGSMTVIEAVNKFEQLSREERNKYFEAKRNQRKVGTEVQAKDSNRGSRPGGRPNQSTGFKKKGKPTGQGGQSNQPPRRNSQNRPACQKCGKTHQGECRAGNPNMCYRCGKEGHYAKFCPNPPSYGSAPPQNKSQVPKAYALQAQIEGPPISQGRLEAPEPEAKIFAYTKGDVDARTSNVVTCQLSVANLPHACVV
ncbi:hypothetical protein UlMin_008800 [Ulmus minor]